MKNSFFSSKGIHYQKGVTLVEMVIAMTLFGVFITIAYISTLTISSGFELQNFIEEVQTNTEVALFKINEELQETNPYYVWVKTYNDPLFANQSKTLLAFVVPRDQNNNFTMKSNYYPDFKKMFIYYPYIENGRPQLRKYEVTNFPSYYLQDGFSFTATINESYIILSGIPPITRNAGEPVVKDLDEWTIVDLYQTGSPLRMILGIKPSSLPGAGSGTYRFMLTTYMGARNKN
jgi:prepilin-type N-terminal cleavage/methylation domain-containing protein